MGLWRGIWRYVSLATAALTGSHLCWPCSRTMLSFPHFSTCATCVDAAAVLTHNTTSQHLTMPGLLHRATATRYLPRHKCVCVVSLCVCTCSLYVQVTKRFPTMPFTLRALSEGAEGDAKQELSLGQMRLGLTECLSHSLMHPYPVLHEKQGDLVAQVRGTCWVQHCICLPCLC